MTDDAERLSTILAGLPTTRGWQEDFYRDLHSHPELSHQEHRTAGLVAERLTGMGYEVHPHVGGTGVVGILTNGDGPTVLLRADIDALPIQEATGLPYASTVRGTYWGFGGTDPERFAAAVAANRVNQDIAMNHSPIFAPVIQPTLDTGTQTLVVAALAWPYHPQFNPGVPRSPRTRTISRGNRPSRR